MMFGVFVVVAFKVSIFKPSVNLSLKFSVCIIHRSSTKKRY